MYPNVTKVDNVYCTECNSNEYWDTEFLEVGVYYCLHKFGPHKYCGGIKAKCSQCNRIESLTAFGFTASGKAVHRPCKTYHMGLTILKESNETIANNVRMGYVPANITDLRDFLAQRRIWINGINYCDKWD